ncbi:hypothetical protein B0H15DRAFT_411717 [Mycena belliarum]|uniref:DUF4440 domain-containing protein n=1 Tax=Mycena belliarum TaxID=1033014 RepID=A0AAD6XV10_9AGAR|nr:hypothetical protein B0H15DRAFT_411717 [Mycena belliae]
MRITRRFDTSGFSEDQLAVLAVAEAFLLGIERRDKALMLAQIHDAGGAALIRNGAPVFTTLGGVVARIPFEHPKDISEVISATPTILVDRDLAMAWTPYEFWIDGKVDHEGTDIWSFVKTDGKWLVSSVADNFHKPAAAA